MSSSLAAHADSKAGAGSTSFSGLNSASPSQRYQGRYQDSGRVRFAEMIAAEGLGEVEIEAMRVHRRVVSTVFLAASFGCILATISGFLRTSSVLETATCLARLTFLSMSLWHYYSELQIRERRFGGLGEFLRTLL